MDSQPPTARNSAPRNAGERAEEESPKPGPRPRMVEPEGNRERWKAKSPEQEAAEVAAGAAIRKPPQPKPSDVKPPKNAPRHHFEHHGDFREILVIFLINMLFNILTLTIYRFWGKTRIRRYLWAHTTFLGEPFEYSGTGRQLFIGFLVALAILGPFVALPVALYVFWPQQTILMGLTNMFTYVFFYLMIAAALYRANRYRLSRTHWRGLRANMSGNAAIYTLKNLIYWILIVCTFGLFWPYSNLKLREYELTNTWYGDTNFSFTGDGGKLLPRFLLCFYLLGPLTLGLSYFWYKAAEIRYVASRTRHKSLWFEFDATGAELALLVVPNFLMVVLTLGIAYPYVLLRKVRFLCRHLTVIGEEDVTRIRQNENKVPRWGEGMADFLGVGGI